MASREGIAAVLRYLQVMYPTMVIAKETGDGWLLTFPDESDESLLLAAKRCVKQAGRQFPPSAGDMQAELEAMQPKMDATTLLKQIEGMGSHNVRTGWMWPRVEQVRERFGSGIAAAYGMVGPGRFASEDATTRDIATRDFRQEIKGVRIEQPTDKLLGAGPPPSVIADLAAKLDAKRIQRPQP